MLLRIIVPIFQYSYIAYLLRIISYYFQNKHIDVSDTCDIQYMYRIRANIYTKKREDKVN